MIRALILALLLGYPLLAVTATRADGSLDTHALHAAFTEGDLEQVKSALESYLKDRGRKITTDEKIFAFKYLGVIHAHDAEEESAGKVRAESYFYQLLSLSPHITLAGMGVSDKIEELFEKVRTKFRQNKEYSSRYDSLGKPIAPSPVSSVHVDKDSAGTESGLTGDAPTAAKADSATQDKEVSDSITVASSPPPQLPASRNRWKQWALGGSAIAGGTAVALFLVLNGEEDNAAKMEPVEIRVLTPRDR